MQIGKKITNAALIMMYASASDILATELAVFE
jgi:hypothetical protein